MQSKKRFTETNLWDSAWFGELTKDHKLMWLYLNDKADNIGVWEPNFRLAEFHTGINFKAERDPFLEAVNKDDKRIKVLENENWFLTGFVRFQYCSGKPLSSQSNAHNSYLKLMEKRNLWDWFCKNEPEVMPFEDVKAYHEMNPTPTLQQGYSKGTRREKDKDKEPDKESDKDTETETETPADFEKRSKGFTDDELSEKFEIPKGSTPFLQ